MLKRHFPIMILLGAVVAVILTNVSFSAFLIGWDNLLPELNIWHSITLSLFSAWQQRGLGFPVGLGEAADLPRQLMILPLTFVFPLNLVRQAYIFLTLGIGGFGAYFLIKSLIRYKNYFLDVAVPTLGALFYLFNLATIQTFYAPLEPFVTHFAFLPWLLLSALHLIAHRSIKSLLFFLSVNILALPQSQVPTVFIVYIFSLSFFLLVLILETKNREIIFSSLKVILLTFAINAFWILPFLYFLMTNSQVAFSTKISQMSTETVFSQNKEFGNLSDVILLRGFWFNNVDPNLEAKFDYMLKPWREHLTLPIQSIGYLFFLIILIGFIYIKRKKPFVLPFSALFLLSFTMLAVATPPFSWIDNILRSVPLFGQAFRFPFTKFSIVAALTYSFFFAIGVGKIIDFLLLRLKSKKVNFVAVFIVILIFIFIFPVFKSNFFYIKEKTNIPNEYFELFKYFKSKDPDEKIANFPQNSFWGWTYTNWGYGGSGFLWYGMPQLILDRDFDVWSRNNENYYWEISYALYSKNPVLFEKVLNKYQVNYLLFDGNIINPTSPKALFRSEFKDLVNQIPAIKKDRSFGNLDIYKVDILTKPKKNLFLTNNLATVNPYEWGSDDRAYFSFGNYISQVNGSDFYFPFRTIFSGKSEENKEFEIKETGSSIEILSRLYQTKEDAKLTIPSNNFATAKFFLSKTDDGKFKISVDIKAPEIYLLKGGQEKKIWGLSLTKDLFIVNRIDTPLTLSINNVINFKINSKRPGSIGSTLLLEKDDNIITLNKDSEVIGTEILTRDSLDTILPSKEQLISLQNAKDNIAFVVKFPKIEDGYSSLNIPPAQEWLKRVKNCENFRKGTVGEKLEGDKFLEIFSVNSTGCIDFYSQSLDHNKGYVLFVENRNKQGRPLHFWLSNEDEKNQIIDTFLLRNKKNTRSSFVLPPQEKFGKAYSFHFENIAIGEYTAVNDLGSIYLYPIPYDFLTSININETSGKNFNSRIEEPLQVSHSIPSLYTVKYVKGQPNIIVLSQSFDPGWKAYESSNTIFPFFGKELKDHVVVNNWSNGWNLNNEAMEQSNNIVIVFLPQYLEYLGFLILLIILIYLLRLKN